MSKNAIDIQIEECPQYNVPEYYKDLLSITKQLNYQLKEVNHRIEKLELNKTEHWRRETPGPKLKEEG